MLPETSIILEKVYQDLPVILRSAFVNADLVALLEIHKTLFEIYETALSHPFSKICLHEYSPWLMAIRNEIETVWLKHELFYVQYHLPDLSLANNPELLCSWFMEQSKIETEMDKSVLAFLRDSASIEKFNIFLLADAKLNYRFCDALALAQIHFSEIVKTEIVSNMFDECGNGVAARSHSRQLTQILESLGLKQPILSVWGEDYRPYAGHNLYFFLGLNRKHYFKSIGSLAMPELFDPYRNQAVVAGIHRLYPEKQVKSSFYASHIETDELHGLYWLKNVITPISQVQPDAGIEMAIGGALRMRAMRLYNEYLIKTVAVQ